VIASGAVLLALHKIDEAWGCAQVVDDCPTCAPNQLNLHFLTFRWQFSYFCGPLPRPLSTLLHDHISMHHVCFFPCSRYIAPGNLGKANITYQQVFPAEAS
jgi:hypothetical protein